MMRSKFAVREVTIFILTVILAFAGLMQYRYTALRTRAEREAESKLWMEATNPEIVERIREPIDNINWGYYIGQFIEAAANPVDVLDSYFGNEDHQ